MPGNSPVKIVAGFFVVFGLSFTVPGVWLFREHIRILRTWPEIEAEGTGGNVLRSGGTEYFLRYVVDGTEYVVPFSSSTRYSSHERAEREAERYHPGTKHRIRYNPQEPFDVREGAGPHPTFFFLPALFTGLGLVMLAAGAGLLIWKSRRTEPACPACGTPAAVFFSYCRQCGTRRPNPAPEDPGKQDLDPQERCAAEAERARLEELAVRKTRTVNRIGGIVFGGIGLALLVAGGMMGVQRYRSATSWPEVQSQVARSQLEWSRDADGELSFLPRIEFRYFVGGQQFQSLAAVDRSRNYAWARRKVERHPAGAVRPLRYNPIQPADILVDARFSLDFFMVPGLLVLLGLIFSPLGLALLYTGFFFRPVFCISCRRLLSKIARFCVYCGTAVQ